MCTCGAVFKSDVLEVGSFGSQMLETALTRADAAKMLMAAKTLLKGNDAE